MKMYILVKENLPKGIAPLATAHASLAAYLKFENDPETQKWVSGTFYKVICKVTEKEFEKAKTYDNNVILTESSLNNEEVAIAFKPREEWPKAFKFYRLYK
ncbi:hypothetical protein AAON49_09300 [Pseudotenacibaculum sp. MALMAid0570]|uniref:hypothetical protein n=1 Tax=Pseudotenacibaculum sp. MALMAid0570 TaxID=3143938 RepID=UPI0032DFE386